MREADALFIARGDQNEHQEFWEGTATEHAINYLMRRFLSKWNLDGP